MKLRIALLLSSVLVSPAYAADNAVTMTLGSGVTFRSVDVGAGIQSMMHIMGSSTGTSIYGTAGTSNTNVLSVQGIAGGTALPVTMTSTTITGTVAATQSGIWTVQPGNTANTTAWLVTGTGGTFPVTATNLSTNISQINAVTPLMGNGVTGTGSLRVTVASDNTPFTVNANATLSAETTKIIGTVNVAAGQSIVVTQGTATNLNATVAQSTAANLNATVRTLGNIGNVIDFAGQNASSPTAAWLIGGQFNTTPTTITSGNASPLQLDASGNLKVNIVAGAGSGGTASTFGAAFPATGTAVGMTQGGNMVAFSGTSGNLNVQCANCSGSGVSTVDAATFTPSTSLFAGGGGFFQTTATNNALTTGQQGMFQVTSNRALFTNLRSAAGTELGVAASPLQVSLANTAANGTALLVTGTGGTFPVTATNLSTNISQINSTTPLMGNGVTGTGSLRVTLASDGTAISTAGFMSVKVDQTTPGTTNAVSVSQINATTTLAGNGATGTGSQRVTIANDNTLPTGWASSVAIASTTSGQTGPLAQCAVTTAAPTYTTAQTDPLSCDTSGGLRVNVGTVTVTATNLSTNVAQINGVTPLMGNGVTGTGSSRVTLASDGTAISTVGYMSVKIDQTTPGTTNAVSVAQINTATTLAGNGASGTGAQRITISNDNSLPTGWASSVAIASTTAGQTGPLAQCAVTTAAPTYTTAQTDPLSCDTSGNLRVSFAGSTFTLGAGSAIVGKVGIDQTTPGTTNAVFVSNVNANGQTTMANSTPVVIASNQTVPTGWATSSGFSGSFPGTGTAAGFIDATGNMVPALAGPVANVASALNMLQVLGVAQYNATPLTVTNTRYQSLQSDINGSLKVNVTNANTNGQATAANSSPVVQAGFPYETIAASQTAQVLGGSGAAGDYLSHCVVTPATTSPGVVTIIDNATTIVAFPGGASSTSNLVPFTIPMGAYSSSGAWKVTTGANVSVVCMGRFT